MPLPDVVPLTDGPMAEYECEGVEDGDELLTGAFLVTSAMIAAEQRLADAVGGSGMIVEFQPRGAVFMGCALASRSALVILKAASGQHALRAFPVATVRFIAMTAAAARAATEDGGAAMDVRAKRLAARVAMQLVPPSPPRRPPPGAGGALFAWASLKSMDVLRTGMLGEKVEDGGFEIEEETFRVSGFFADDGVVTEAEYQAAVALADEEEVRRELTEMAARQNSAIRAPDRPAGPVEAELFGRPGLRTGLQGASQTPGPRAGLDDPNLNPEPIPQAARDDPNPQANRNPEPIPRAARDDPNPQAYLNPDLPGDPNPQEYLNPNLPGDPNPQANLNPNPEQVSSPPYHGFRTVGGARSGPGSGSTSPANSMVAAEWAGRELELVAARVPADAARVFAKAGVNMASLRRMPYQFVTTGLTAKGVCLTDMELWLLMDAIKSEAPGVNTPPAQPAVALPPVPPPKPKPASAQPKLGDAGFEVYYGKCARKGAMGVAACVCKASSNGDPKEFCCDTCRAGKPCTTAVHNFPSKLPEGVAIERLTQMPVNVRPMRLMLAARGLTPESERATVRSMAVQLWAYQTAARERIAEAAVSPGSPYGTLGDAELGDVDLDGAVLGVAARAQAEEAAEYERGAPAREEEAMRAAYELLAPTREAEATALAAKAQAAVAAELAAAAERRAARDAAPPGTVVGRAGDDNPWGSHGSETELEWKLRQRQQRGAEQLAAAQAREEAAQGRTMLPIIARTGGELAELVRQVPTPMLRSAIDAMAMYFQLTRQIKAESGTEGWQPYAMVPALGQLIAVAFEARATTAAKAMEHYEAIECPRERALLVLSQVAITDTSGSAHVPSQRGSTSAAVESSATEALRAQAELLGQSQEAMRAIEAMHVISTWAATDESKETELRSAISALEIGPHGASVAFMLHQERLGNAPTGATLSPNAARAWRLLDAARPRLLAARHRLFRTVLPEGVCGYALLKAINCGTLTTALLVSETLAKSKSPLAVVEMKAGVMAVWPLLMAMVREVHPRDVSTEHQLLGMAKDAFDTGRSSAESVSVAITPVLVEMTVQMGDWLRGGAKAPTWGRVRAHTLREAVGKATMQARMNVREFASVPPWTGPPTPAGTSGAPGAPGSRNARKVAAALKAEEERAERPGYLPMEEFKAKKEQERKDAAAARKAEAKATADKLAGGKEA